jgi:hypothetical protein
VPTFLELIWDFSPKLKAALLAARAGGSFDYGPGEEGAVTLNTGNWKHVRYVTTADVPVGQILTWQGGAIFANVAITVEGEIAADGLAGSVGSDGTLGGNGGAAGAGSQALGIPGSNGGASGMPGNQGAPSGAASGGTSTYVRGSVPPATDVITPPVGGAGGAGSGGAGGTGGPDSGAITDYLPPFFDAETFIPSANGGQGGTGGGGGGGGGLLYLAAPAITIAAGASIHAKGQAGGKGGDGDPTGNNGGGGGGAGGDGGIVLLISELVTIVPGGGVLVTGGAGGLGGALGGTGAVGLPGAAGKAGQKLWLRPSDGSWTYLP